MQEMPALDVNSATQHHEQELAAAVAVEDEQMDLD
jgi:hypothetical protein